MKRDVIARFFLQFFSQCIIMWRIRSIYGEISPQMLVTSAGWAAANVCVFSLPFPLSLVSVHPPPLRGWAALFGFLFLFRKRQAGYNGSQWLLSPLRGLPPTYMPPTMNCEALCTATAPQALNRPADFVWVCGAGSPPSAVSRVSFIS